MLAAIARIVLAAVTLFAIGTQLTLHLRASYSLLNFFGYFTNLSNLFAAFVLLYSAVLSSSRNTPTRDVVRFVSVMNMTVVGVVFSVLLRNVDLGALLPWVNVVLHYVMPVAVVIDWILIPPASRLHGRHLLLALIFPALYLVFSLLRGANFGWYPYPFLNPAKVGGYAGVAAYSLGIATTFLLTGWALMAIGNLRNSR